MDLATSRGTGVTRRNVGWPPSAVLRFAFHRFERRTAEGGHPTTFWTVPHIEDILNRPREPYALFSLEHPFQDTGNKPSPSKTEVQR